MEVLQWRKISIERSRPIDLHLAELGEVKNLPAYSEQEETQLGHDPTVVYNELITADRSVMVLIVGSNVLGL